MSNAICTWLILLSLLSLGGCPVYDFDLKTIEQPTLANDFSNKLKWEAELGAELAQGFGGMNAGGMNPQYENKAVALGESDNKAADASNDFVGTEDTSLERSEKKALREITRNEKSFVGTNLFDGNRKKCFSMEEVALLTARRDFEVLIPKDLPQCLLNDKMIEVFLHYFNVINEVTQRISDDLARGLTEKALYDTVGGYIKYYLMPITKYSFYGGKINTKAVDNVVALYQRCKELLNTNGNGWKPPIKNILTELENIHIEPLKISMKDGKASNSSHQNCELKFDKGGNEAEESVYCTRLDLSSVFTDAEENQMIVPLPKLEPEDCEGFLSNIWLPFKHRRSFNLRSKKSAFIVVKFYETVSRCYRFQCLCQDEYNNKFRNWISENIQIHLEDDQFYPGLGAVLRISENLKRGKKAANNEEYDKRDDDDDSFKVKEADENLSKDKNNNAANWGGNQGDGEASDESGKDGKDDNDHEEEYGELDGGGGHFNMKVNCPKKPFHKKKKIKCTPIPQTTPRAIPESRMHKIETHSSWFARVYDWFSEKHICWLFILLLLLLLMILLCALLRKRRKQRPVEVIQAPREVKEDPPKSPSASSLPSLEASPAPKKKRGLCSCFRKPKKNADDEMLIRPDNSSVLGQGHSRAHTSSLSSVTCHPPRCLPIRKLTKASREPAKSDAAVIETTSLDYSSSEVEDKADSPTNGSKQKLVTIDEKKNKRNNANSKQDESNDAAAPRIGIQRSAEKDTKNKKARTKKKDSLRSTSWETMYES